MAIDDETADHGAGRPAPPTPMAFDRMGVAELERHVAALRAEILRAEAQIAAKLGHRSAADGLFKF